MKILFTKLLLTVKASAHTGFSNYPYLRPPNLFLSKDAGKALGADSPNDITHLLH